MKRLKVLFIIMVFPIIILKVFASDFDSNFSFLPLSGTNIKLYCEAPVYFMISWWDNEFNGFAASIKFDSENIQLMTWIINPELKKWKEINEIDWNLYHIWWNTELWEFKTWTVTGVVFSIKTKNNINSTTLYFVWSNWLFQWFWLDTTDDWITLNGFKWNGRDILTSVTNATYNFVALPCDPDNKSPIIGNLVKFWTPQSVNNKNKIASGQILSFETYDWNTENKVTHWFSWGSAWDLSNYVVAPNNVDNQEWVNSSSILVAVSCPACDWAPSTGANLTIMEWNWDTTKNALTWDSERRWYNVSINPPFPYEVEKKVTVNISVADNPNEFWVTHTWTRSFSFNAPVAPSIVRIYPATNTFISPSKEFPISFYISDDWAGIDVESVIISTIYSGKEFVYSWSDLTFELSWWSAWLWNAWSYLVSFKPKEDFPVSTDITLNVVWVDLAWTTGIYEGGFTTRPSCDFFWCVDNLNIILGGVSNIFTWKVLSITWTNPDSPYPYFTWENNEILMCWWGWTWINFVGNIIIYDVDWNLVWNNLYTNNELFITWLDFVYEDWRIIVQ